MQQGKIAYCKPPGTGSSLLAFLVCQDLVPGTGDQWSPKQCQNSGDGEDGRKVGLLLFFSTGLSI